MCRSRTALGGGRDRRETRRGWGAEGGYAVARCKATNANGARCDSPEPLVDAETGLCPAHAPGGPERMADLGRKGAAATARKWRGAHGLEPGELPELRTPHDAQRALDIVAHAAAEGRLPQRQADATTRAVREWLRAWEAGALAEQVAQLQRKVAALGGEKLKAVP